MNGCIGRVGIAVLLGVLLGGGRSYADSRSAVCAMLKECGVKMGYDAGAKRFVAVGVAEKCLKDPANDPNFEKVRLDLSVAATLNGKRDIMFGLSRDAKGTDTVETVLDGETAVNTLKSVFSSFAEMKCTGFKVLCTAESWEAKSGVYQMAVAVGWSEKNQELVGRALANGSLAGNGVDDEAAWAAWAGKNDLSAMFGTRQFVDPQGVLRLVGMGAADVEGLAGPRLRLAQRKAGVYAVANLAFLLYGDTVARELATRYLREIETEKGRSVISWESFCSEIAHRCRARQMRAHEVHVDTVRHPITGRKTFVSVYGAAYK